MSKSSIEWFQNARYGMFYHFGLYTLLGGNENKVRKEWGKAEYRKLIEQFNPVNFDAEAWVDCAISMGAEYIVPTAKHAEGFCLWDSKLTEYKSTNTPFGRDIIGELSAAAKKKGIKFSFYFNLEAWMNEGDDIWNRQGMSYADFFQGQLEELLTSYGPVSTIWFDHKTDEVPYERLKQIIARIKELQPDCLVNDRGITKLDPGLLGDYVTPEREVPEIDPEKNLIVECCDAMGVRSWGYCKDEGFWSVEVLGRKVSACASKGYNYLLNVEPAPDGSIRPECVCRAAGLGNWIRSHRTALQAGPSAFEPCSNLQLQPSIGVSTVDGNTLYLHLWQWPESDEVLLKATGTPVSAVFEDGTELTLKTNESGIVMGGLPELAPGDSGPWIISLVYEGELEALPGVSKPVTDLLPGQSAYLIPADADIPFGSNFRGMKRVNINRFADGKVSLGGFHNKGDLAVWQVIAPDETEFDVYMSLGSIESQVDAGFELSSPISTLSGKSWFTGHYSTPERRHVGRISLAKGLNDIKLLVTSIPNGAFSDVHGIWLIPV